MDPSSSASVVRGGAAEAAAAAAAASGAGGAGADAKAGAWERTARKVLGDGTATPFFRAMNFELFASPTPMMRSVAYTGTMVVLGFPIYYYLTTSLDETRAVEREKAVAKKKRVEEEMLAGVADPFEGLSPQEIDRMARTKPHEAQRRWIMAERAIEKRARDAEQAAQMHSIKQAIFKGAEPLPPMDDDKYSGMTPEEIDAAQRSA